MNQTTLTEYLVHKLTKIQKEGEYAHKDLLSAARNLDMPGITTLTARIKDLQTKQQQFSADAIKYLTVDEVVKNHTILDKPTLEYGYKGTSGSGVNTLEEAQLLKSIGIASNVRI